MQLRHVPAGDRPGQQVDVVAAEQDVKLPDFMLDGALPAPRAPMRSIRQLPPSHTSAVGGLDGPGGDIAAGRLEVS